MSANQPDPPAPGFLQAQRRRLLPLFLGLIGLIFLAVVVSILTKRGVDLILPLFGLSVLLLIGLITLRAGSFNWLRGAVIPLLAVTTALIIGAFLIAFTDRAVLQALGNFFDDPGGALRLAWNAVATAYSSMFEGAIGSPTRIADGLEEWIMSGEARAFRSAMRPIAESLTRSIPYVLTGLAVALGFRAGLFNIGAEGQFLIGGLCAVVVGFSVTGLPAYIHLPLAILAGAAGGAVWGGIVGALKAWTGAHEVINTIMMNWIAFRLVEWLLRGPLEATQGTRRTAEILDTAKLPRFFEPPIRLHAGLFIAIAAALFVWWFLWKTTWGFEMRTVGANPNAARYSGMNIGRNVILAMALSGTLAGLAGVSEALGLTHNMTLGFQAGYGFDSIALALLGNSHPGGVVLASLLFGVLRSGGTRMMSVAGVPLEITSIIQAMVIIFIAAPAIVRSLYRLDIRRDEMEPATITRGWGS
ncbi:MAG: ABC transporter permease [Caldilineales bacterium]|nr:ABC transporter permease [Caldilineales bacterium]